MFECTMYECGSKTRLVVCMVDSSTRFALGYPTVLRPTSFKFNLEFVAFDSTNFEFELATKFSSVGCWRSRATQTLFAT